MWRRGKPCRGSDSTYLFSSYCFRMDLCMLVEGSVHTCMVHYYIYIDIHFRLFFANLLNFIQLCTEFSYVPNKSKIAYNTASCHVVDQYTYNLFIVNKIYQDIIISTNQRKRLFLKALYHTKTKPNMNINCNFNAVKSRTNSFFAKKNVLLFFS